MKVLNVHERALLAGREQVGALLDSLSSPADALWPAHLWPRMRFDRPLSVGAAGGHGPIRYFVEAYAPGRSIRFRFTGPRGFDGWHGLEVLAIPGTVALRHTLEMTTRGLATLSWPLVFRPLHDALIEDALAMAEAALGHAPRLVPWPLQVRLLRSVLSGGKAHRQSPPGQRPSPMPMPR
jgi:hypothetical protein